jgi:hypothetical protein
MRRKAVKAYRHNASNSVQVCYNSLEPGGQYITALDS